MREREWRDRDQVSETKGVGGSQASPSPPAKVAFPQVVPVPFWVVSRRGRERGEWQDSCARRKLARRARSRARSRVGSVCTKAMSRMTEHVAVEWRKIWTKPAEVLK